MMTSQVFVCIASAIALILGSVHLVFTYYGKKLNPRDSELEAKMKTISPVITRQTTMWKVWVGINVTHSLGIILFGLVYGYLALEQPTVLFHSVFLAAVGGAFLITCAILSKAYFFSDPLKGVLVALVCYGIGFGVAWA